MSFSPVRSVLLVAALALTCSFATAAHAEDDEETAASSTTATLTHMEMRISGVEDQMRSLTGKIEQIDYATRRLDQMVQRLQSDYDARLTKLESTPAPQQQVVQQQPAAHPAATQTASEPTTAEDESSATAASVNGTLGDVKVRGGAVTGGSVNPKTPALPNKPADYGLTTQEQYDRAFGMLRQANYDEAEKAFKTFIDKNPKDKLTENAKYWYAETHYVRGHFKEAAVAFADAYEQDMQGSKAPDALLKLSMSLAGINKTDDACNTLSVLKAKYPKAPAAVRARADQERSRMKCK